MTLNNLSDVDMASQLLIVLKPISHYAVIDTVTTVSLTV